jgi:MFS transporter, PPP family, 3-phenylpropionic acid transporter
MPTALRLGLVYVALYVGSAASTPFMPIWLSERGLTGAQVGLVLSLPMLLQILTSPALALWADRFRLRRTPIAWLAAGTCAVYLALAGLQGLPALAIAWLLAASLYMALPPLIDVIALSRAQTEGFNYGLPRGLGSAAYIGGAITTGALVTAVSVDVALAWMILAAGLTALWARFVLPPDPAPGRGASRDGGGLAGLKTLMRDPVFLLAVGSAGLIQSAHAFYYAFSALAWKAQGLPESLTGLLWGLGVGVEVVFLWFGSRLQGRLGPRNLLVIGGVAGVLRWTLMAAAPPLWALVPLQALHALTYTAVFLASIQLASRLSGPQTASAAQLVNAALQGGILSGLATLASGPLFDSVGSGGYLAMSGMAAIGLLGAFGLYRIRRLDT